jgi:NAD(P)-dependent dehydrogenase (short-subunit alcohol dehydrogenase family)
VVSRFGRLDILVNNAGRAHTGGLLESSELDQDD